MKLFALLAALAALFVLSSAVNTCPVVGSDECNGLDGECILYGSDGFCSCRSGYGGADCTVRPTASGCVYNDVSPTATYNVPTSVQAFFDDDALTVTILSPLVNQRNFTKIAIDYDGRNDYHCTYPGQYWEHIFDSDGCADKYVGVMPWSATSSCGWTLDNTDTDRYTYNADMTINHYDYTVPFDNRSAPSVLRTTQHVVPLEVSFPRYIDVNTEVVVQSPVRLLVGISQQVIAQDRQSAIVELTTNLLYPYKLTTPSITSHPSFSGMQFDITETGDSALCPNTEGQTCTQVFQIAITSIGSNCEISGDYDLLFTLTCQLVGGTTTPTSCAINSGDQATATVSVTSEDFCPSVSVDVDISGSLSTFQDSQYNTIKTNYLVDQVVYFRADLTSNNITLQSSTINSVKIQSGAEVATIIFQNGNPTAISGLNWALDAHDADTAGFHFTLKSGFVNGIPVDQSKTYTITAKVDVTFTGVPGVKRVVLVGNLNKKTVALASSIALENPNVPQPTGSASVLAPVFAVFAAILALLF